MAVKETQSDIKRFFDIKEKVEEVIRVYYRKTKIESILVDSQADLISKFGDGWLCNDYYCEHTAECRKDHQLVLKEADRLGGPFVYLCHKDFFIWGVSISDKNQIIGGVISGFVLSEQHQTQLKSYEAEFPRIHPTKSLISSKSVNDASQLLFDLFRQENLFDNDLLKRRESKATIQREIAEKIIEKKDKDDFSRHLIYQKQQKLMDALRFLDVENIRSGLNEVLSEIFLEGINDIKLLKFRMLELFVLISRTMLETGGTIDDFYHLTNEYTKHTEEFDDIYTFSIWLTDILNDFIDMVIQTRKKLGHINRAIEYIKHNLDQKLTISQVSSKVGMSKSRFALEFKQETGITFSEYVNVIKVDKAKEMIRQKQYSFVEIAMKLGFFDQSYFTKIFKKYTGTTPRQFAG